jgi:regulatory protein
MRITKIVQIGKEDKFGIFVDDKLSFYLDSQTILKSSLSINQDLSTVQLDKIQALATYHKFYLLALRYVSRRFKSEAEVIKYLTQKGASKEDIKTIMDRLIELDLVNDERYVQSYIQNRLEFRPASKRKIMFELKKHLIASEIINRSLLNDQISDLDALRSIMQSKRHLAKYKDPLKLMRYLVGIGFNYSDIKEILAEEEIK